LQALLDERSRQLANDLRFLYVASGLILLVAIIIGVLARGRRHRRVADRSPGDVRQHSRAAPPTLSSARDLLDAEALVTAGRPRGTRDAGDAQ
jgi:hypothetical protein